MMRRVFLGLMVSSAAAPVFAQATEEPAAKLSDEDVESWQHLDILRQTADGQCQKLDASVKWTERAKLMKARVEKKFPHHAFDVYTGKLTPKGQ